MARARAGTWPNCRGKTGSQDLTDEGSTMMLASLGECGVISGLSGKTGWQWRLKDRTRCPGQ